MFIENVLNVSQLATRERERNLSWKTVKGSIKGDSTPVSYMATRGNPTFQKTTDEKDNSTPIPTFY